MQLSGTGAIMCGFVTNKESSGNELEELFVSNLALIDRIVRSTCRPYRMSWADVDDFGSHAKVRIMEGDYAILRKFERRGSLGGYLCVVIQRMFSDYRIHALGKWRPSAEAKRLGPVAMRIESLLVRDRLPQDEIFRALSASDQPLSRAEFDRLVERIPLRHPRPRLVEISTLEEEPTIEADQIENDASSAERASTADAVGGAMNRALAALPEEDLALLRMRFVAGLSVADIARSLHAEQKALYRRLDSIYKRLRCHLVEAGVDKHSADEIIGKPDVLLEVNLLAVGSWPKRPSLWMGREADAEERFTS